MALSIGSKAPDFTAQTTQGQIRFHEWLGDSWGIIFSHPKDFTPVCTTELGYLARLTPEFEKRNCKVIGLSVDPVGSHERWLSDIKSATGGEVKLPDLPGGEGERWLTVRAVLATDQGLRNVSDAFARFSNQPNWFSSVEDAGTVGAAMAQLAVWLGDS